MHNLPPLPLPSKSQPKLIFHLFFYWVSKNKTNIYINNFKKGKSYTPKTYMKSEHFYSKPNCKQTQEKTVTIKSEYQF